MSVKPIAAALTAVAGLAIGYLLGGTENPSRAKANLRTQPVSALSSGTSAEADARRELDIVWQGRTASEQMLLATALGNIRDPAQIRALLDQTNLLPANVSQGVARGMLLRSWLESDPEAAALWAAKNADRHLTTLLETWAAADPAAALAHAHTAPAAYAAGLASAVLNTVATTDPERAREFLIELAPHLGSSSKSAKALTSIAAADPAAALDLATSLGGDLGKALRNSAAGAMAKADYASAVAWWEAQPDKRALAPSLFTSLAPEQWGAAIDRILAADKRAFEHSIVYKWADKDPARASALLAKYVSMPDPPIRSFYFRNAFRRWVRTDRAAASEWASQLSDGEFRTNATNLLEQGSPKPTPVRTTAADLMATGANYYYAIAHLSPEERSRLPEVLAELPADRAANVLHDLMGNDDALHLIDLPALYNALPAIDESKLDLDPVVNAVRDYARTDPADAAQWAEQFPPGQVQSAAAVQAARMWNQYDPSATRAWAESLSDETSRTAVLKLLDSQ